ncbi:unnamed protein product, partial [Mesorhabditis belari]|uniref:Ankyrin repeat and sterile alpha motif domain-containing protein 1B n=1 Tax=Mesorhabditis belari TaxID=2138241 RepID=A0AAF3FBR1_9BILA
MVKELSNNNNELFEICRKNDLEKLQYWLTLKRSKRPRTPLNFLRSTTPNSAWLAAIRDPNSQYTVLHTVALHGYEAVCQTLIESDVQLCSAKDKRGCLPLHLAAWNGHLGIVKLLCEAARSTIDSPNNAQETAMHLAAQHGHSRIVQMLIDYGADASVRNARCETPLDIAARTGHASVVKILVTLCPDLALQSAVECASTAENGRSAPMVVYPIHAAARHSHIQCLQMLRFAGFDLNYVTDEGSALHVAAMFGQIEAVKYLIEEGINPHIKDSRGRSVLEMLDEHENQRASDLTQVIQSRDGWRHCRRLIQTYIQKCGHLNSSSDSGIDRPDADRSPKEVIWRPLPSTSRAANDATRSNKSASPSSNFRPPSIRAELIDLDQIEDPNSTISISTKDDQDSISQISPCSTNYSTGSRWSSRMSDGRTPRFPLTSPNTKSRHSSVKRFPETMPASMSIARTNTLPTRASILPVSNGASCVYKPPPGVEPKRVLQSDGTSHTYNPGFSYDNVPSNRQWVHDCNDPRELGLPPAIRAIPTRSDGTQTLPAPRNRNRPNVLQTFSSIQEDPIAPVSFTDRPLHETSPSYGRSVTQLNGTLEKNREGSITSNGSVERKIGPVTKPPAVPKIVARWSRNLDREDSLGLGNVLDTREPSVFTFACSTLGRQSNSPPSVSYSDGRAPLAIPEELTRSTSTSIMSNSMSPERTINSSEKRISNTEQSSVRTERSVETIHDPKRDHSLSDTIRLSFPLDSHPQSDPPSPQTSQSQIFDALCGSESFRGTRRIPSTTSMGSESTAASTCSLPLISQISTTPPSSSSPQKEPSTKQISTDTSSSIEVKMRGISLKGMNGLNGNETARSLNETAEWNKINAILGSFGGAVCRESVFASRYEPQVAVFLRDRHSRALTIQKKLCSPFEKPLSVPDWLNIVVGVPQPRAIDAGKVLVDRGFDKSSQMKISLNRALLHEIGIDKVTQGELLNYLETIDFETTSANSFNYISDWLCSLELTDYLGNFLSNGFKSMLIVRAAELNTKKLNEMGITKPGHIHRILGSLARARDEEKRDTMERKEKLKKQIALEKMSSPIPPPGDQIDYSQTATFSAHYLGSVEISNIDGTEESRRAMNKLKRQIREIAKVPQVHLEISVDGVNVHDATTKRTMTSHPISQIQIVCQDERDLNCFAYITQDIDRNFAHVFCVLTADVATEIIMTLGSAFEMAYNLQRTKRRSQTEPENGQGSVEEISDV